VTENEKRLINDLMNKASTDTLEFLESRLEIAKAVGVNPHAILQAVLATVMDVAITVTPPEMIDIIIETIKKAHREKQSGHSTSVRD
jgi:hypothetical protein